MKLVVQDGTGLPRRLLEKVLPLLPRDWQKQVQSIVVYSTYQESLSFTYIAQSQSLGVHWPSHSQDAPSRENALAELGIALVVIAKTGELPRKLSRSAHASALSEVQAEIPTWLAAAADDA